MSHHKHHLSQDFHNLSQQNKSLHQNLIAITVTHQNVLEQNKQLKSQIKKQQYSIIESNLRQKNVQHTLQNVQKQYTKIQNQYKTLYDWMRAEKKLEIREVYKKQTQFAMDLAYIEGQSYRQTKKAKNQQLNTYQQKIINLMKQNQRLKTDILEITSDYNNKIYELKKKSLQNQVKLNSLKSINLQKSQSIFSNNQKSDIFQQLQLKMQNLQQKLTLSKQQNKLIKSKNQQLFNQIKQLNTINNKLIKQIQSDKNIQKLKQQKIIDINDYSVEYITQILKQNLKIHKQIQQLSNKYILLTQTYPNLIQQYQEIKNLEQNVGKFTKVKDLEDQISQLSIKLKKQQLFNKSIQKKYLEQIKQNQSLQYKLSILTKRFNQIFIKINPYFNIYLYQDLQFDQNMYKFFDQNKNYKSLKQYEMKILQLKRQIKQKQLNYQTKQNQLLRNLEQKESDIKKLCTKNEQIQSSIKNLTQNNLLLKYSLKNKVLRQNQNEQLPQENKINQENNNNIKPLDIQTQITVPLLQGLIQQLHNQREQLLKIIYQKDKNIIKLQQQIKHATFDQSIHTISIQNNNKFQYQSIQSNSENFAQLIKQNQKLQQNYDYIVEQLRKQITKIRIQSSNQNDYYQLSIKNYQRQYQQKLQTIQKMLNQTLKNCQNFKKTIQEDENKRQIQKQKIRNLEQQKDHSLNGQNLQMENQIIQEQNRIQEEPNQNDHLLRQPSHTHLLQQIHVSNNQDGNRLIGQSTVQNLTSTLKKYEHDMSQVLQMCSKISQQYAELKQKLKNQQQLQIQTLSLKQRIQSLFSQNTTLSNKLSQNNQTLSTIQSLYNMKSSQLEEIKNLSKFESKQLEQKLEDQKRKNHHLVNQLNQIKEKMYQLNSKPLEASSQGLVSNGQFQTIVVMHANKNKQINQLATKNTFLETKVQSLMRQVNLLKQTAIERKSEQMSPLQKAEIRQLSQMLHETNIIQLIKKANQIVEKQSRKEAEENINY